MKQLIVCGDSFNAGVGCPDIATQFYGVLAARKLGMELVTLARGSASNFTIYLQGKYVADNIGEFDPGLVVLGTTSTDRLEWISENKQEGPWEVTANQINYHEYSPYFGYIGKGPDTFYFKDKPNYNPRLLSEQIVALEDYKQLQARKIRDEYYVRLRTEPMPKLQTIMDYAVNVMDRSVKVQYDAAVIFMAYSLLKAKGIRCLLLSDLYPLWPLVDKQDFIQLAWGEYARKYPDSLGTLHASEVAHAEVAELICNRIGS